LHGTIINNVNNNNNIIIIINNSIYNTIYFLLFIINNIIYLSGNFSRWTLRILFPKLWKISELYIRDSLTDIIGKHKGVRISRVWNSENSICEIKMTKFRWRMRYSKNSSRLNHSNILISSPTCCSDIQISEYVRNSELHLPWAARCTDIVRYVRVSGIYFKYRARDSESTTRATALFYIAHVRISTFLPSARARPIRFKNLSIAVPRGVKRAEVPGACYVPTMRILRLRLSGVAYAIPSCRTDISRHLAAAGATSYVHHRRWIRFLSRRGKPEELYCTGRINPPLNRAAFRLQIN